MCVCAENKQIHATHKLNGNGNDQQVTSNDGLARHLRQAAGFTSTSDAPDTEKFAALHPCKLSSVVIEEAEKLTFAIHQVISNHPEALSAIIMAITSSARDS